MRAGRHSTVRVSSALPAEHLQARTQDLQLPWVQQMISLKAFATSNSKLVYQHLARPEWSLVQSIVNLSALCINTPCLQEA